MANKYRGEVEFEDSEGTKYVLRLGMNDYIKHRATLDKLTGVEHLRATFHAALVPQEARQNLTIDQVGDLLDDIGYERGRDLIVQTKYGGEAKRAAEKTKAELEALLKKAEAAEDKAPGPAPVNPPPASTSLKG